MNAFSPLPAQTPVPVFPAGRGLPRFEIIEDYGDGQMLVVDDAGREITFTPSGQEWIEDPVLESQIEDAEMREMYAREIAGAYLEDK